MYSFSGNGIVEKRNKCVYKFERRTETGVRFIERHLVDS